MADDKRGRDKQAQDEERRQRRRDMAEQLERRDETEPPIEPTDLSELDDELDQFAFPVTGAELVDDLGDQPVDASSGSYTVGELLPETETVTYERPADVRARIQRPTIAVAMKRVIEASETLPNKELGRSQREAYEKTFRALKAIDADDDDEGISVISDWIVERIRQKGTIPGSREVRREAATFCRSNGYSVRNDEWLGV